MLCLGPPGTAFPIFKPSPSFLRKVRGHMLTIRRFTCENQSGGCVTDERAPRFGFSLDSDRPGAALKRAVLTVNGWRTETADQIAVPYGGAPLEPFTRYTAKLTAVDDAGEEARGELEFETGRLDTPWAARWISDGTYSFTEKRVSPVPMTFRKTFALRGEVRQAKVYATAMGIYALTLNGGAVGEDYFTPGFTSYKTNLQYQTYDVTELLRQDNTLTAVVAGGWAVGSFVFTRKNRVTADRQALLLELRLTYADGTQEVIGTDETWQVTEEGPLREADLYDGEVYDATAERAGWHAAGVERLRVDPAIRAAYGPPVRAHEVFAPISRTQVGDCQVYDFGQNFAGVVRLRLRGKRGQKVVVRHAEVLNPDGSLNTAFLRTAKARIEYICADGEQTYSPRFTYMGFRYVSVEGIAPEDVEVTAAALYSDVAESGGFACSNEMLCQLQSNIRWGAKSNFVDIPTDCPQRDERMGWTGDIAVFAPTACFNFDMSRFLEKWLLDVQAEQLPGGGIPNTVPAQGYGFPATMPAMAVDWWGDACVLVPWAEYMARGDLSILRRFYPVMKKYVKACKFWAGLLSVGKKKYIWDTPSVLHFGDWVAPDVPRMQQWQGRSKWTATASLCHTSAVTARVAQLLGEGEEAAYYRDLSARVADAYCAVFTDGKGKLLEEFQTAYVLPLQFDMFPPEVRDKAAANLRRLAQDNGWRIGTGFPGTPYLLFALADHGQGEAAWNMLLNTQCPSWLYEVKMGATTIWERWDGLDEKGQCPIGDDGTDMMISYNHYASGAVGDFLYRRAAGIEPLEAGYRRFAVRPLPGGGLTWASAWVETPYGRAAVKWTAEGKTFTAAVTVPVGTTCELTLPDGSHTIYTSGSHTASCPL